MLDTQALASVTVGRVAGGENLNRALAGLWQEQPLLTAQQRGAITDLCYGTLRFGLRLQAVLDALLAKKLSDPALRWLLLVTLYQLEHTRAAPYAIVDHAVRCVARLGTPQAGGLVNAVLRNFLRRRAALLAKADQSDVGRFSYPQWWIDKVRAQLPQHYALVLHAGNLHPPYTLRVNARRMQRSDYLALLEREGIVGVPVGVSGVRLARALPVGRLPGFADGIVSVQDAAAQIAAPLLEVEPGMRVLDACAAPGGKTTHLLELADLDLTALDHDAARLDRVRENLERLDLKARLLMGNAADPASWWDGEPYQRILADVPCSASGVVRRHPDIKWLRRPADIKQFAVQQERLVDGLWKTLASGGKFLYTTCSIFEEENCMQLSRFLARHADARTLTLHGFQSRDGTPDGLLLPDNEHDGFFYALLQKI